MCFRYYARISGTSHRMDGDGTLTINISSGETWPATNKKQSRNERLRTRKRKRGEVSSIPRPIQTTDEGLPKPKAKIGEAQPNFPKAKAKSSGPSQASGEGRRNRHGGTEERFSALFTKNPQIPYVKSTHVRPITEAVFSGNSFKDLNLHPYMVSNLEEKFGFTQMTAVQKMAIPQMIDGHDLLIKSQTGSGKTVAYAVPIVEKLHAMQPQINRGSGLYAIVIVPTRELALQSCSTFLKLTRPFNWVVPGSLMGGEKRKAEKARLRKGLNIIISPPGRLLDHLLHTESLRLDHVQWLVIDEADRLMDLGFEKEVSQIVAVLDERAQQSRQTVLLSATLGIGVEKLAGMSLSNPVHVSISQDGESKSPAKSEMSMQQTTLQMASVSKHTETSIEAVCEMFATPENLHHQCVLVPSKLRLVTLAAFLVWKCQFSRKPCKLIVFMATQDTVEFHHHVFKMCLTEKTDIVTGREHPHPEEEEESWLFKLHGEMPQKERTKVFQDFSEATYGALICTDIAARGLDLPAVEWIVQYHPTGTVADYIHRVGRTARAGSGGQALLFLTPAEVDYIQMLNDQKIKVTMVEMESLLKVLHGNVINLLGGSLPRGKVPHSVQESAIALQRKMEMYVYENQESRTLARRAYQSFIRAYTTYPVALRHVFNMKNLHLGHLAKSFCLTEAPGKIGSIVGKHVSHKHSQNHGRSEDLDRPAAKKAKLDTKLTLSEYGDGRDRTTMRKTAHFNKTKRKKGGKK